MCVKGDTRDPNFSPHIRGKVPGKKKSSGRSVESRHCCRGRRRLWILTIVASMKDGGFFILEVLTRYSVWGSARADGKNEEFWLDSY